MAFSKEEFLIMVDELLYQEPISFTMLCSIAEKTLKSKIKFWCANDEDLRGRGYENDIMQEVQFRLMKTAISYFLLKDGPDGPVNDDPEGFRNWMIVVALNLKRDFANAVRSGDFNTVNIDNPLLEKELVEKEPVIGNEDQERLKEAFSIVISSEVSIYKVLTWLAQFVFVIDYDVTKIKSNEIIIELFEEKTLFELYDILLKMSYNIAWIEILPSQHERIINELKKPFKEGKAYGDVKYKEFFMMVNGKKSGKKSISDWVNRMNNIIQKKRKANKISGKEGV